jgi:hypothetical protein
MRELSKILMVFLFVSLGVLGAVDLPQFYRAPFFQETFGPAASKYTTGLSVRYGHGQTSKAWNGHNETQSIPSIYGCMDITNLGSWVCSDEKVEIDTTNKKTMKDYWGGYYYDEASADCKDKVIFPPDYRTNPKYKSDPYKLNLAPGDGRIAFDGKFEIDEWDFTLQQDILWGFYVQVYLPYRDMKISNVCYKNCCVEGCCESSAKPATELTGVDKPPTKVKIADFMDPTTGTLNNVLKSMCMDPWQKTYKKTGLSDLLVSAGWNGSGDPGSPVIKRLNGSVQVGILIPTAGDKSLNDVFAIPLGYNDYWGVSGRVSAYVQLFDFLGIGVYGGGLVFFTEDRDLRVKTALEQDGPILLQKSFGKLDQGAIWDVCGYAQLGFKGVFAKAGCSYTRQEDSVITIKDDCLLATYKQQQLDRPPYGSPFPNIISVDSIVNTDQKLKAWEYYTAHFVAGYAFEGKTFCPSIFIEYDYPFYGKYAFKTDMLGGTLSLQAKISF